MGADAMLAPTIRASNARLLLIKVDNNALLIAILSCFNLMNTPGVHLYIYKNHRPSPLLSILYIESLYNTYTNYTLSSTMSNF